MKPVTLLLIAGGVGLALFVNARTAAAAEAERVPAQPPEPRRGLPSRRRERKTPMPTSTSPSPATTAPAPQAAPQPAPEPPKPKGKVYPALETPGGGRIKDNSELKPVDKVMVQAPGSKTPPKPLHRDAAAAYLDMVAAARADGIQAPLLDILSGYRSDAEQKPIWEKQLAKQRAANPKASEAEVKALARKWVAPPGFSNHRSGRTVDLNMGFAYEKKLIPKMQASAAHKWLVANAAKFGFYPYEAEPWHWEYNPKAT